MSKLQLGDILDAIDQGGNDVWDILNEEQKKEVKPFLLNRYLSYVESRDREIVEHFVVVTNELVNKHHYAMSKHPKLMWQLMCGCSLPSKKSQSHKWLGLKRVADGSSKVVRFLQTVYPNAKIDDLEVLATVMDKKELKQLAKDHGYDDKQISDLKL